MRTIRFLETDQKRFPFRMVGVLFVTKILFESSMIEINPVVEEKFEIENRDIANILELFRIFSDYQISDERINGVFSSLNLLYKCKAVR